MGTKLLMGSILTQTQFFLHGKQSKSTFVASRVIRIDWSLKIDQALQGHAQSDRYPMEDVFPQLRFRFQCAVTRG